MEEDYSKDNRRVAKTQAKVDHFKNGKSKARRHKDKVVETKLNTTQEAEISHIGFKNRNALAEETLKIINGEDEENKYSFTDNNDYITNTKLYSQKNEIKLDPLPKAIHEDGPDVEFLEQNLISFIWEIDESELDKWVLLNYANPIKPGGGFDKEASAYEESLVLSSGLYRSLKEGEGKSMYEKNYELDETNEDGVFRTDLIYSPNVPFFRNEELELIDDENRKLSIISIPAINYIKYSHSAGFTEEEYENKMRERINRIYRAALKNGHTKIILGPWGCGLEGGPLKEVIQWFSEDELSDLFDQIYFICDDEETVEIMQENF
jgi:uncharacterized protein (TIGR02452 family)